MMLRLFIVLFGLSVLSGSGVMATESLFGGQDIIQMYNLKNNKKPKTEEESVEFIQAYMLENIFLGPIFNTQDISILTEDDEEEDILGMKGQFETLNKIMVSEWSKQLAKKDILKLKKHMTKAVKRANSEVK